MVKKILVATDGSELSLKAARFAIGLARQVKGGVVLVHVIDASSLIPRPIPGSETPLHVIEPMEDYVRDAATVFMNEIVEEGQKEAVAVEKIIKCGDTVDEIIEIARLTRCDLIAIGSRGHGAVKAAVLGSIAYGVIHRESDIPVLVIR